MRLSTSLSLLCLLASFFHSSVAIAPRQGNQRNGNGNNNNGNNGGNGNNNNNAGNGNNNAGGDPQRSLTVDPRVIASGFANDGQDVPVDGQVPSLTSTNNFINFCLTVPNLPITNGQQITTGSCNPTPIGVIPSVDRMPSSKFTFPQNGGTIPANQQFTISMAIRNLQTGSFTNAQQTYFAAPQQLNNQGTIIGHSHVVVELLNSLDQTTPTDPKVFAFFKGLNAAAQNGVLTADVASGLPAGAYRLCSINAAANHQPVIAPVAQHGSLDDCVYFTATNGGGNNNAGGGSAASNNNNGQGNNNQNQNQNQNQSQNQNQNGQNGQGNNRGNGASGGNGGFGGNGRFGSRGRFGGRGGFGGGNRRRRLSYDG